jgi:hypothetical protein
VICCPRNLMKRTSDEPITNTHLIRIWSITKGTGELVGGERTELTTLQRWIDLRRDPWSRLNGPTAQQTFHSCV